MSLQLPFGVRVLNPLPVEDKYLNNGVPYTGTSQVNTLVASGVRFIGLTVNINNVEYWYATGTSNNALVVKSPSVVSGGGITGATNGLHKNGANVLLGGALTQSTTISGGTYALTFQGYDGGLYFNDVTGGGTYFNDSGAGGINLKSTTGGISIGSPSQDNGGVSVNDQNAVSLYYSKPNHLMELILNSNGTKFSDSRTGTTAHGIEYNADYSANYSKRSLVDKSYVTGLTTTISVPVTGASNGLSVQGKNTVLGGTLTGNTTIDGNYNMVFGGPSGFANLLLNSNQSMSLYTTNGYIDITNGNGNVDLSSNVGSDSVSIDVDASNASSFKIIDLRSGGNKTGIQYQSDYSANFVARSLVDKGYVTGLTTTSGVQTANNGLTKSGTNVHLGGTLTGNTTISGSTYQLNLGGNAGLSQINLKSGSAGITTTSGDVVVSSGHDINLEPANDLYALAIHNVDMYANNQIQFGASNHQLTLNPSGFNLSQAPSSILTLGSNSGFAIDNSTNNITTTLNGSGTFKYAADYSANYVARSIPDKAYVDSIAAGFDPKQAAFVATVSALTGATYHATGGTVATGSFTSAPTTVDGIALSNGKRILVKNQVDPKQNGIYTVISAGTWYRSADLDGTPANEVSSGDYLFIQTGATQAATGWVLTGNGVLTINTDPLNFVQFSAANSYIAGTGINILGNVISNTGVVTANNGLTKSGTNLYLGGALTGNTDIGAGALAYGIDFNGLTYLHSLTNNFKVENNIAGNKYIQLDGNGFRLVGSYGAPVNGLSGGTINVNGSDNIHLYTSNPGAVIKLQVTNNNIRISDTSEIQVNSTDPLFQGLVYSNDFSANYVNRSLVDKGYVDTVVGAASASTTTTANNGLTKSGNNIHLGGALTGDTIINGGTSVQKLQLGDFNTKPLSSFVVNTRDQIKLLTNLSDSSWIQAKAVFVAITGQSNVDVLGTVRITSADINTNLTSQIEVGEQYLTITDNRTFVPQKGIEYAADYSANYTSRSLVDKGFVTGITSGLVLTNGNGTTANGSAVDLGGTLTADVNIGDGGNGYSIFLGGNGNGNIKAASIYGSDGVNNNYLSIDPTGLFTGGFPNFELGNQVTGNFVGQILSDEIGVSIAGGGHRIAGSSINWNSGPATSIFFPSDNSNLFLVTDNTLGHGLQYAANYSSNFTPRSLVDKAYVTGLTNAIVIPVTSVGNGLSLSGTTVVLGGALTGDTTIRSSGSPNKKFILGSDYGYSYPPTNTYGATSGDTNSSDPFSTFKVSANRIEINNGQTFDNGGLFIRNWDFQDTGALMGEIAMVNNSGGDGGNVTIRSTGLGQAYTSLQYYFGNFGTTGLREFDFRLANSGTTFTDHRNDGGFWGAPHARGIEYAADYSSTYSKRSLVDKAYVTGLTSGGITSANNGLTQDGQNVRLGGSLTGNTGILIDNYIFQITGASSSIYMSAPTLVIGGNSDVVKASNVVLQSVDQVGGIQIKTYYPNYGEKVDFSFNTGAIFTDSRTGTTAHGIEYAADYSANYSNRSLVDKGYVDNATTLTGAYVTGSTYTMTSDQSFIGVSGTSGSLVYLPASPVIYKQYIVADIAGNAFMDNITVNGNGKLIQGASTAVVNTDYGSLTFVYNGFNWSVVAIV